MFKCDNPYLLRTEIVGGITKYYIAFTDGQGAPRETEVSRPVYLEFCRFIKVERNLLRADERHHEFSELNEATLYQRTISPGRSIEEIAFDSLRNKYLWQAIQALQEIQRRRFILHHEFGLTYEKIAKMEGCTRQSATRSVKREEAKIREKMKIFRI